MNSDRFTIVGIGALVVFILLYICLQRTKSEIDTINHRGLNSMVNVSDTVLEEPTTTQPN